MEKFILFRKKQKIVEIIAFWRRNTHSIAPAVRPLPSIVLAPQRCSSSVTSFTKSGSVSQSSSSALFCNATLCPADAFHILSVFMNLTVSKIYLNKILLHKLYERKTGTLPKYYWEWPTDPYRTMHNNNAYTHVCSVTHTHSRLRCRNLHGAKWNFEINNAQIAC